MQAPHLQGGDAPQAQLAADGARPAVAQLHMHASAFCDDLHNAVSAGRRQLQLPPLPPPPLVAQSSATAISKFGKLRRG